jgi:hypothetical protein
MKIYSMQFVSIKKCIYKILLFRLPISIGYSFCEHSILKQECVLTTKKQFNPISALSSSKALMSISHCLTLIIIFAFQWFLTDEQLSIFFRLSIYFVIKRGKMKMLHWNEWRMKTYWELLQWTCYSILSYRKMKAQDFSYSLSSVIFVNSLT